MEGRQVSHQMVQRGHGPAYHSTVYHNKQGYHQAHPGYLSEPHHHHKHAPVYPQHHPVKPYHPPPPPIQPYKAAPVKPYHSPPPPIQPYKAVPLKPYHSPVKPYHPVPVKPYHPPLKTYQPLVEPYHPPSPPPPPVVEYAAPHHAPHLLPLGSTLYRGHPQPHPLPAASHLVPHAVAPPPNYIHGPPAHQYHHKPAVLVHHPPPPPEYPDEPRLYKYAYSVDDDYEGAILKVKEESDEYGTQGSYEVSLDDGRHQSVSYVSDKYGGYKAKVAYKDQHSSYTRTK